MLLARACCELCGIGLGHAHLDLRALGQPDAADQLLHNPPLAMLSGGLTTIEAMPKWVQPFTHLHPIAHFATSRSVLSKGAGLDVVYPNLLALFALASVFVAISAWRFRRQLV